eukprot:10341115-Alexandrium_andersonii.AAC.1
MPACCMARSNRSGPRWAASTMPARWNSQAQAERRHWWWMTPLHRARACRTASSHSPNSCS